MPQANICTHEATQWSAGKKQPQQQQQKIHLEATWGGPTEITSVLSWTSAFFIRNSLHVHGTPQEAAHWGKRVNSLGVNTTKCLPLPIFSVCLCCSQMLHSKTKRRYSRTKKRSPLTCAVSP